MKEMVEFDNSFANRWTNLADERLGTKVLYSTDDFFAEKENIIKPGRGIFIHDKYTDRGKWMDGWESRRKRVAGHDFLILKLGGRGLIHGLDIDTNHFLGNHPPFASVEAADITMENDGDFADDLKALEKVSWTEILSRQSLRAGLQNLFKTKNNEKPFTHVKLHIFPDGGVARFRVFGDVVLDWSNRNSQELFDMASVLNGGQVLHCNDMFFGPKDNLIVPGRGINMGDGWETRRRRMPGNDYVFLKLGHSTVIEKIDIDTAHFKGNYPHAFMLEGCRVPQDIHYKNLPSEAWKPLMTQTLLQPDHLLTITSGLSSAVVDHVKLNIYPCGGVSRLRLWGKKHR